jgi:hypothetical protein
MDYIFVDTHPRTPSLIVLSFQLPAFCVIPEEIIWNQVILGIHAKSNTQSYSEVMVPISDLEGSTPRKE